MEISRTKLPMIKRRRRVKMPWRAKWLSQWRLKLLQWAHNSTELSRPRQYITPYSRADTQNRTQHYPVGTGCDNFDLSAAYLNANFTGADATDLSDSEAAELNDIDSYLSTVTQMGA